MCFSLCGFLQNYSILFNLNLSAIIGRGRGGCLVVVQVVACLSGCCIACVLYMMHYIYNCCRGGGVVVVGLWLILRSWKSIICHICGSSSCFYFVRAG